MSEEKKVKRATKGKVKRRKRGFGSKVSDYLSDLDLMDDIIIPTGKKLLFDMVESVLFHGEKRPKGRSEKVSYRSYYDDGSRDYVSKKRSRRSESYDYDEIIYETRGEAEAVLDNLEDAIKKYHAASIADLYDISGVSNNDRYTDNKYGWTSLRFAEVERTRDGYRLRLPKVQPLD